MILEIIGSLQNVKLLETYFFSQRHHIWHRWHIGSSGKRSSSDNLERTIDPEDLTMPVYVHSQPSSSSRKIISDFGNDLSEKDALLCSLVTVYRNSSSGCCEVTEFLEDVFNSSISHDYFLLEMENTVLKI